MQGSNKGNEAKDNAWKVSDKNWPVFISLQHRVGTPEGAVDAGHQRLDGVTVLTMQVVDDLRNVGNIHGNGHYAGNAAD